MAPERPATPISIAVSRTRLTLRLILESYLEATHLQISADGLSEGLVDKALREMGLQRKVAATIPNYLVIPWVLRGSDLITHCADSIGLLLDENREVSLVAAPVALPSMPISLIVHRQMATDPATTWLKRLIEDICADRQVRKDAARAGSASVKSRRTARRRLADADPAS